MAAQQDARYPERQHDATPSAQSSGAPVPPAQANAAALAEMSIPGIMLRRMAHAYASVMNLMILALGSILWMHTMQFYNLHGGDVAEGGFQHFKMAAAMLLGNFCTPFFEGAISFLPSDYIPSTPESFQDALTLDLWNFWLPVLMGTILLLYGGLGYISMRVCQARLVVPFALVAVILLAWQVELNVAIGKVAHEEVLVLKPGQTHLSSRQVPHYQLHKFSYDRFVETLRNFGCSLQTGESRDIQVQCEDDSTEARIVEAFLGQVCGVASEAAERRVVDKCLQQGQMLGIMPDKATTQEDLYCRCRRLAYLTLQHLSRWSVFAWFLQFLGVCFVLYFSVEPNLMKMTPRHRKDVIVFSTLGMAVLSMRVLWYEGLNVQDDLDDM